MADRTPASPEVAAFVDAPRVAGESLEGLPAALIRAAELRERPLLEVDPTLARWREAHRRFFRKQAAPYPFNAAEAVRCGRFNVVYRRS